MNLTEVNYSFFAAHYQMTHRPVLVHVPWAEDRCSNTLTILNMSTGIGIACEICSGYQWYCTSLLQILALQAGHV